MLLSMTQDHPTEYIQNQIINSTKKTLLKWEYSNTPKHRSHINYELLYDKDKGKQYKAETEKQLQKKPFPKTLQQRWTNIVTATTMAAENTLGIKSKQKHHANKKV